jgi:MYXO-CTERM domain-containing protein
VFWLRRLAGLIGSSAASWPAMAAGFVATVGLAAFVAVRERRRPLVRYRLHLSLES